MNIVKEYLKGATQQELAEKYHSYKRAIRKILLANGVELRTISEAQKLREHDSEFKQLSKVEKIALQKEYDKGYSVEYLSRIKKIGYRTLLRFIKRRKSGATISLVWKRIGHPRGMLGKKHSIKAREQMSISQTGSKNPKWKGGKRIDNKGYFRISLGKGIRRYEHDLIMENKIGRRIKKGEIVHHIDGNGQNNKIENLKLLTTSQHRKIHL